MDVVVVRVGLRGWTERVGRVSHSVICHTDGSRHSHPPWSTGSSGSDHCVQSWRVGEGEGLRGRVEGGRV